MKKKHIYCLYLIFLLALSSCSDVIEPSLEDSKLDILTPGDTSGNYLQVFSWEKVKNANSYTVRINILNAKDSSFKQIFLADSTIKGTQFKYSMTPGLYEFKIKAINNSSNSEWFIKRFQIISSTLNSQLVLLVSPADQSATNNSTIQLKWQSLFGASKYKLQIDTSSGFDSPLLQNLNVFNIYYNFIPKSENQYFFRLKAISSTDSTGWCVPNSFVYDNTAPQLVTSGSPNDLSSKTYARDSILTWVPKEVGVTYTVKIKYGEASYISVNTGSSTSTSYKTNTNQKISWKVLVTDKAGNTTPESSVTDFSFNTK